MAVDPLKVDNPVVSSSSGGKTFPLKFPAKAQIDLAKIWIPTLMLTKSVIIAVGITYILLLTNTVFTAAIEMCSRPLGILFAISVMYRWNSRSETAFYISTMFAVLALVFTASATLHHSNDQSTRITSSLAMTAILWSAVEIAIHYRSIDAELMRRDPGAAQARREKHENAFQLIAVAFVVAICLALWADSRMIALPLVATFGLVIAYARAVKVAKFPSSFLALLIPRYYSYPDASSLVPGLIESAASNPSLRPIPILIVMFSTPLLSAGSENVVVAWSSAIWLFFSGLYASYSLQIVAASFFALPAHFDLNRAPFDVIISRLRNLEN